MRIERWKSWAVVLGGVLLILLPAMGLGQQTSLTLRQAIDRALGQNPLVSGAEADIRSANAGASMARTALWPRLSATEDLSRGNDPVYVFGTKLRQQRFAQSDFSLNGLNRPTPAGNFATRLSGQWMLFNGFATGQQIHAAKLGAASAASMGGAVRQSVIFEVVEAYQSVLYAQRQLAVAQHEQQTAEALVHDAETRVKAGLAIESDLLGAQVNLSARQQEAIAAEGAVETAWAELEAAMGSTMDVHPELKPMEAKKLRPGQHGGRSCLGPEDEARSPGACPADRRAGTGREGRARRLLAAGERLRQLGDGSR